MTRGRIYLIDKDGRPFCSDEFFSDMYPELPNGHGNEIIHAFLTGQIETGEELLAFSKNAHKRWDGKSQSEPEEDDLVQYIGDPIRIEHITEDYSYIMNCSTGTGTVLAGADTIMVNPGEILVVHFSKVEQRIRRSRKELLLQLSDGEITTCINALDFYSRIFIGQYDKIDGTLGWSVRNMPQFSQDRATREFLYGAIRSRIFKGTFLERETFAASFGIWSEETDDRAMVAYDIQQIMRNKAAWTRNPEGGFGVDFDRPLIHSSQPEVACSCRKDGDAIYEEISMNPIHADIMFQACRNFAMLLSFRIRQLFEYYTEDKIALEIADLVMKLYRGLKRDKECLNRVMALWEKVSLIGMASE